MSWELVYIISGILILPVFIWAIVASVRVSSVINRYKTVPAGRNITAGELVKQIAMENNLHISLEVAHGHLGDHYDPRRKVVALSPDLINSNSISALAVAAHECGHALQDQENYAPLKMRQVVVVTTGFASRFLMPLVMIGLIASMFIVALAGTQFMMWVLIGLCAFYAMSALVNLITLPVEFDASRRAKKLLDQMHITAHDEERRGVNRVLRAAATTYVAALAVSLVWMMRILSYIVLVAGRR